jgi:hypothetical protein
MADSAFNSSKIAIKNMQSNITPQYSSNQDIIVSNARQQ